MQTFKTRFTTDVSQHQRAMKQFRSSIGEAIAHVRNQIITLEAFSIGGMGFMEAGKSMLSLAADMQQTKVAFEVMLGSSEKAKAVLGDLVKFADTTPFDTAEIIAAGRALMACGTNTQDLTGKLELLGNIAAGANVPITEMVAIYAKMANKGKVQTEELNQMAERGIPIYSLLCKMLQVNQEELSSMAEKGQLTFALIQEALGKLGGKGGQYFGLIAKQSKTLGGLWSTLAGNCRLLATEMGELIIPELSTYLEQVISELDRMKKSGELQGYMQKIADSLITLLRSLVDIGSFLARNQETLFAAGKIVAVMYAWNKFNGVLTATLPVLRAMGASGGFMQAFGASSGTARILTRDLRVLARHSGLLATSLGTVGAVAATAFIGWEIGEQIAELTGLNKQIEKLVLWMAGLKEPPPGGEKISAAGKADVKMRKATMTEIKKLNSELQELEKKKVKLPERVFTSSGRSTYRNPERVRMEEEIAAKKKLLEKKRVLYLALQKAEKEEMRRSGKKPKTGTKPKADQKPKAGTKPKAEQKPSPRTEAERIRLTAEQKAREEAAKKKAAHDKAVLTLEKKIADERKRIRKGLQDIADEKYQAGESAKIQAWRKEIQACEKDIQRTEKKLAEFGASLSGPILKTQSQLQQEEKDFELRAKIEAHNAGRRVRFTGEERARIAEMEKERKHALSLTSSKERIQGRIEQTENSLESFDSRRKREGWQARTNELQIRMRAVNSASANLQSGNAGSLTLDAVKRIEEVLRRGLPGGNV